MCIIKSGFRTFLTSYIAKSDLITLIIFNNQLVIDNYIVKKRE